jgi:hypothetical protein
MSADPEFVVVALDAVAKVIQERTTPRRLTEADRTRAEACLFCRACHDWLVYSINDDVQERVETTSGGLTNYIRFVRCPCGAERGVGVSSTSREERARQNAELRRKSDLERKCFECRSRPADHYCASHDQYFCTATGCPKSEDKHPTVYRPVVEESSPQEIP